MKGEKEHSLVEAALCRDSVDERSKTISEEVQSQHQRRNLPELYEHR